MILQFQNNSITAQFVGRVRNRRMERDGRESKLFDQQREQEMDKEREEEISEGEGEKRDEDTSDGEEVHEGRDVKKGQVKTEGKQLFGQLRDEGNLQVRIVAHDEEYTARISRIKDGLQVSEQLAMVGEGLLCIVS